MASRTIALFPLLAESKIAGMTVEISFFVICHT